MYGPTVHKLLHERITLARERTLSQFSALQMDYIIVVRY